VAEGLPAVAGGPVDLEHVDLRGLAEAERLAQRVRAEAPAAVHVAMNRALDAVLGDVAADVRADPRAVRARADDLHRQPVVAEAGVAEERVAEGVARERSAQVGEDVLIAVAVQVRESDA